MYQINVGKARQNHSEFHKFMYALSDPLMDAEGTGGKELDYGECIADIDTGPTREGRSLSLETHDVASGIFD